MSRKEKLLDRLLGMSPDFTWEEAVTLMKQHGFKVINASGSGRKFIHTETKVKVSIHEPHPGNIIKTYAKEDLIQGLKNVGVIK